MREVERLLLTDATSISEDAARQASRQFTSLVKAEHYFYDSADRQPILVSASFVAVEQRIEKELNLARADSFAYGCAWMEHALEYELREGRRGMAIPRPGDIEKVLGAKLTDMTDFELLRRLKESGKEYEAFSKKHGVQPSMGGTIKTDEYFYAGATLMMNLLTDSPSVDERAG